jgi:hypothetical protein
MRYNIRAHYKCPPAMDKYLKIRFQGGTWNPLRRRTSRELETCFRKFDY